MTESKRDAHLKEFFAADVLKQLDEAEKTVLYEEFANSQLRLLASQPTDTIHKRLSVYLQEELKRRLSQIQPEEYEVLKPWYLENCHTVSEIYCSKCGVLLGLEVDTIDDAINPYHHEGKFIVAIGDLLMAYRPRLDGVMGFQCGNIIENEEAAKEWDKFDAELKKVSAEFDKELAQYKKDLDKWNKLSSKKQMETPIPTEPEPRALTQPEQPRRIECGNYTLWSQIELDNIPEAHVMTSLSKEDRIKVKQEMDASGYAPETTENKHGRTVESFELRKVK
jgi:hypothetical protein